MKIIVFPDFLLSCSKYKKTAFKRVKINYCFLPGDRLNSKFPSVWLLKCSLKWCSDNGICPYYITNTKSLIGPCLSAISILFVVNQVITCSCIKNIVLILNCPPTKNDPLQYTNYKVSPNVFKWLVRSQNSLSFFPFKILVKNATRQKCLSGRQEGKKKSLKLFFSLSQNKINI